MKFYGQQHENIISTIVALEFQKFAFIISVDNVTLNPIPPSPCILQKRH